MKNLLQSFLIATVLVTGCYTPPVLAVDTDLFVRDPDEGGVPNIFVMFGNDSSSWESNFGTNACGASRSRSRMIHEAMHRVLTTLGDATAGGYDLWNSSESDAANELAGRIKINLGFGIYTDGKNPNGAKVFKHIQLLDTTYRDELLNSLYANGGVPLTSADLDTVDELCNPGADGKLTAEDYAQADGFETIAKQPGNASPSRSMAEILRYFQGAQPMSGTQDVGGTNWRDNEDNRLDERAFFVNPPAVGDAVDLSTQKYRNDFLDSNACGDNHIIYFGFSRPQSSVKNSNLQACDASHGVLSQSCAATTYTIERLLTDLEGWDFRAFNGGSYISVPGFSAVEDFVTDEWAQYMFKGIDLDSSVEGNQVIKTHWINVTDDPNKNPTTQADQAFFQSVAENGGGEYELAADADEVVVAFLNILSSILATNSVFASTALPVSVNVRGTNLNQIYLGVFRADGENRARWWGNLKQYKLGLSGAGNIELQDADGNTAQGSDGFIQPDARSLWTHDSSYWSYEPRGNVSDTTLQSNDNPDGEVVEKGGAAQNLREALDDSGDVRELYTYYCTGAAACQNPATAVDLEAGGSATQFSAANGSITAANTGVTDALAQSVSDGDSAARQATFTLANLIAFYRGQDVPTPFDVDNDAATETYGDEDLDTATTDARPQMHGDVLHSRPAIVNYNRLGDDSDVVVFYGSNEGMIHALQGGDEDHPKDGDASSTGTDPSDGSSDMLAAGTNIWSFLAQEHYAKLSQQFQNDEVDNGSTPRSTANREIFFDGTFTVLTRDNFNEAAYETVLAATSDSTAAAAAARTNLPAVSFGDGQRIITGTTVSGRTPADADEAYLFAAARRGGDLLYAFDVSNPYKPTLTWRRRGQDGADGAVNDGSTGTADPGYEELGQTWSAPLTIKLKVDLGSGLETKNVLIFGKGYDPEKDDFEPTGAAPVRPTNTSGSKGIGAGIMIVDADTGEPIWQSGSWIDYAATGSPGEYLIVPDMTWSIPSDVTPVDRDRDGIFEKFYVGDTGGNVWRGDITDSNPANWTVTQLANLGNHVDNRVFCLASENIEDTQADCPDLQCDLSGTAVNNPLDCPWYVCANGDVKTSFPPACPSAGFNCPNSGVNVANAADCPNYRCDEESAAKSTDIWVAGSTACLKVCENDTSIFTNDKADCVNKPKKLRVQNSITQEVGTPAPAGTYTQESASPEEATPLYADDDRRFLFAPDVVPNSDPDYDAVLIGSGDRELPDAQFQQDRFYMLKDPWLNGYSEEKDINADAGGPGTSDGVISAAEQGENAFDDIYPISDEDPDSAASADLDNNAELYNATNNTVQQGTADTLNPDGSVASQGTQSVARDALDEAQGWYINLIGPKPVDSGAVDGNGDPIFITSSDDDDPTTQLGEKVVSSAVTLGGTVFFNTNEPESGSSTSCATSLGTARSYAINYRDGSVPASALGSGDLTERFDILASGGFPPSPVPFVVEIDGNIYSGVQIGPVPREAETEIYNQRQRVFWFQDVDIN